MLPHTRLQPCPILAGRRERPLSSTSQNWTRLQTSVGQHQMFEHDEGVGTRRDIATRYFQEVSLRSPQDLDTQTRRANETRLPNPPSPYQTRAGRHEFGTG